ncbi:MAG: bifunctional helix-turn-helix transcriptional regulator/GNAT family N-acetyltransferase [Acidobacteriia bacterium]|nr:bifunctional helix-turn-helix transcriptional regulator/GNAT family N-acetyltransferase [Terriglobia bacterium]
MAGNAIGDRVSAVRRFNRFYTRQIGLLQEGLYKSPFSLTEVRVLYELAHRERPTASELGRDLGLDAGYLSRILRSFEKCAFLEKEPSAKDGRQSHLAMTRRGRKAFAPLDVRSQEEVAAMLGKLLPVEQARLVQAMETIEKLLGGRPEPKVAYILRPHQPGDMGWVVHRHGVLYNQEYGYDERFEALVAKIAGEFIENLDSRRERCWIAEREGEVVGCVFLVKKSATVSKLRLLLVEPSARGLGIGRRLVEECIRFARQAGYKKMMLWTQSELTAARGIYEKAGFKLIRKEKHADWGRKKLVSEIWELKL